MPKRCSSNLYGSFRKLGVPYFGGPYNEYLSWEAGTEPGVLYYSRLKKYQYHSFGVLIKVF